MSGARGLANQRLYHARVLLTAWQQELERAESPQLVLNQAFGEAVRVHLLRAYGWFLLELANETQLPGEPPASVSELTGVASSSLALHRGELSEFQQLEQDGFVGAIQRGMPLGTSVSRPLPGQIGRSTEDTYSLDTCRNWCDALESTMDRMSDSLAEC